MNKTKYNISERTKKIFLFIIIIAIIMYATLIFSENSLTLVTTTSKKDYSLLLSFIDVIKNVILVFISVVLSTFISTIIIDVNRSNEIYREGINELLFYSDFYNFLNKNQKKDLVNKIEGQLYPNRNKVKTDMVDSIKNKLLLGNEVFYYEECSINITCSFNEDKLEKNIIKRINLRSYDGQKQIKNFEFVRSVIKNIEGYECFKIESINVNGNPWKENKDYIIKTNDNMHSVHKKGGYNIKYSCIAKKDIAVCSNDDTVIDIQYKTVVYDNDNSFSLRISEHCKKFNITFKIDSANKYNIYSEAFGFIDDGKKALNDNNSNNVKFEFNDWIYKNDGVSISFQKN